MTGQTMHEMVLMVSTDMTNLQQDHVPYLRKINVTLGKNVIGIPHYIQQ